MKIFFKSDDIKIIQNPTENRIKSMLDSSLYKELRGILSDEGDFFVWKAEEETHAILSDDFEIYGTRIDLNYTYLTIVLAGGALELLDYPEKIDEFFQRHGFPDSNLDDLENIKEICKNEINRIKRSNNIIRCLSGNCNLLVDIDPRQDFGLQTIEQIKTTLLRCSQFK